MFRTAILILTNEFRLLMKDRVGLFMLILAPIVIIAVAGLSLGNIYGTRPGPHAYFMPVVDHDHGPVAGAIIGALKHDPSLAIALFDHLDLARQLITARDRVPLALLIPAGTSAAFEGGRSVDLVVYGDPAKRLEVTAIELRLAKLCQAITAKAHILAARRIAAQGVEMRARLDSVAAQLKLVDAQIRTYRIRAVQAQTETQSALRARMRQTAAALEQQTQAAVALSLQETKISLDRQMAARRDALAAVNQYLRALKSSEGDFSIWLNALKAAAGSHAGEIPPPPAWPAPPTEAQLAQLTQPIDIPVPPVKLPPIPALKEPLSHSISLPGTPTLVEPQLPAQLESWQSSRPVALPGDLGWSERSLSGGRRVDVNTFDQSVPGFGITFLLIGMLMGISLGLIDERDWGTLQRLRVSGASFTGVLVGKLFARFLIGVAQMVVLFVIGRWLFDISLGLYPPMLLLPAAAISFAGAAFGLVIACVARTHDAVLPVGAIFCMTMSAIGGCWWPLDFEPGWMRAVALWLPTTWSMEAFNNLMIRHLPASSALWPSAAAFGLGTIYLTAALFGAVRLYE